MNKKVFSQPRPKDYLTWRQTAMGLKLIYSFFNLIIPLPGTYVRHFRRNYPRRLVKQIQRFVRWFWQKDCWSTADVNVFKLLPRQLYCPRLYTWNSNADTCTYLWEYDVNFTKRKFLGIPVDHFDFRFSTSLIHKKLEDDYFYLVVFKVWCPFSHTPFPWLHFLFSLHVVFVFFSFGFYVFSCLFLINRYASDIVILAFI